MSQRFSKSLVMLSMLLLAANYSWAQSVPPLLNYQGYVRDSGSHVPITGIHPMFFSLFADSTGGVALWTEAHPSVNIDAGFFNVLLGSISPLSEEVFTGETLWIETTLGGSLLMQRKPLVSVPYALVSGRVNTGVTTELYSLNSYEFFPQHSDKPWEKVDVPGAYVDLPGESWGLFANVHLPHGAIITEVTVYFTDNSAGSDLRTTLWRHVLNGGIAEMASVVSSGTPGTTNLTDSSIVDEIVDNSLYSYDVSASPVGNGWDGTDLAIQSVRITYEITR